MISEEDLWMAKVVSLLGPLPSNYIVFDVESTGLDINNDLIVQIGYLISLNKKIAQSECTVIDWTRNKGDDFCNWLQIRMENTRLNMLHRDPNALYKHSIARMKESGVAPNDAFTSFMDTAKLCAASSMGIVAHNGFKFDQPMIDIAVKQLRGEDENFKFDIFKGLYFDTMGMERGVQSKIMPNPDDNWQTFTRRLVNEGGKLYSSLGKHCNAKYNLVEKHNLQGAAHEADFDCKLTYHLFEEYRAMADRGLSAT